MIETGVLDLEPEVEKQIREIACRLNRYAPAAIDQWEREYRAFARKHLAPEEVQVLQCSRREYDLLIGSLSELPLDQYYRQIAQAAREFVARQVSYESLTAWVHLLEDAYLPYITKEIESPEEALEILMSLDALLHNDFAIIASAYFEAREREIIERNRLLAEMNQRQNQLLAQIITAQEDERRRISIEIHDGPTQSMSAVLLTLQTCRLLFEKDPQTAARKLEEVEEALRANIAELRRLINDLRPPGLDDIGLVSALKQYFREFLESTGLQGRFEVKGKVVEPDWRTATMLFRIVQECLNNVRKHAQATQVRVKMKFKEDLVKIVVADDGKGFDPKGLQNSGRPLQFGLLGMRERAEMLGGSLIIDSAPGKGTKITLSAPLQVNQWREVSSFESPARG